MSASASFHPMEPRRSRHWGRRPSRQPAASCHTGSTGQKRAIAQQHPPSRRRAPPTPARPSNTRAPRPAPSPPTLRSRRPSDAAPRWPRGCRRPCCGRGRPVAAAGRAAPRAPAPCARRPGATRPARRPARARPSSRRPPRCAAERAPPPSTYLRHALLSGLASRGLRRQPHTHAPQARGLRRRRTRACSAFPSRASRPSNAAVCR
mmetsp:Transcript_124382/g.348373  ORF Transcript_124382/g.348373 Transcript_124382/m.348373 type:complete len:206 (+) Transcript_124382:3041-3658(+)